MYDDIGFISIIRVSIRNKLGFKYLSPPSLTQRIKSCSDIQRSGGLICVQHKWHFGNYVTQSEPNLN